MQISRAVLGAAIQAAHARGTEGHRAHLLGHLRRSRRARHRQPRARVLRGHRLRRRQAARRVSRAGPRAADHRRARSAGRAVPGAGEDARRQARRAHLDAHGLRSRHAEPSRAAGRRGPPAVAARAVRGEPGADDREPNPVGDAGAVPQGDAARARVRPRRRHARWPAPTRPAAAASFPDSPTSGSSSCSSTRASRRSRPSPSARATARAFSGVRAAIGTLALGKQADLVVVAGDPSRAIGDVRKVDTVFRQGVGFDSQKLIQSVSGRVGLW